jgi:uncharacterized damage-inducible protein DinB
MRMILDDLYGHMAWADAEHWLALEAVPIALADSQVGLRLHHIHMVQHAFLAIVEKKKFEYRPREEFTDMRDLKRYAMDFHNEANTFLTVTNATDLQELLVIPWFQEPPLTITMAEALMQAAMHSQYHRGQNGMRLRMLGGEPPLTDYIAWLWKNRPAPVWLTE